MESSAFSDAEVSDAEDAFFKSIVPMLLSAFIGMCGMVFLGIATVVNIIDYAG